MRKLAGAAVALIVAVAAACGDDPEPAPVRHPNPCKPPPLPGAASIDLVPAFGGATLARPVELVAGPGGRFYALEQSGRVRVLDDGGAAATPAYDVTARVTGTGEAGLLGIAFDPKFADNGFVYLYFTLNYTTPKPGFVFQDVLVRVQSKDGGLTFDPATEKVLLALDDPFDNGNGGRIVFGPDGFLYVGVGDGGSRGPTEAANNKNAQDTSSLFGKILRIDPSKGEPYAIPPGNPFANGGGRPEIWAYGLRNPWKFSFDRETGELWAGDVGERRAEEIDLIVPGGNYGWNVREGRSCFSDPSCPDAGFLDPVVEYARSEGISIVAGFVYRGAKVPSLAGKLLYGDFGNGNIWSADAGSAQGTLVKASGLQISSFAEGPDGELFVLDYGSGAVSAIVPAAAAPAPVAPASTSLAATGCLDQAAAISYDVASPLWSDDADKQRWLFVADGESITVGDDGDFDVPPGSTAVKTFSFGGKKVETRLFARYEDGTWAGWSYEWSDDQKDAVLLEGAKTKPLADGKTWTFPSPSDCLRCHTQAAGFTLGLEARQVEPRPFTPYLAAPIDKARFPTFARDDGRAYLHANCSGCHRPGASAGAATMDLRFDRSVAEMNVCNQDARAGFGGSADPNLKLVTPGAPERSILFARMVGSEEETRMPPIGRTIPDPSGTLAVSNWIQSLGGGCP
ncbi:MAG: PQQ-dependent sugar dehydrogenase [Labilithrix sp.]|nr:PQQ-dependent sugar dehydrogenase [Labilithrix sp.]MCW5811877.1 PQQ-dependent sugar dehydrogenase [Labilithrix sp.]